VTINSLGLPNGVTFGNEDLKNYDEGTYTPTWSSTSGTPPSLGNGVITGDYTRIGNTVNLRINLVIGSTTTTGTGAIYTFTSPFPAKYINSVTQQGILRVVDSSPARNYSGISMIGEFVNTSTIACFVQDGLNYLGYNTPITFATGDIIVIMITYAI
jgi:hypothetical protein